MRPVALVLSLALSAPAIAQENPTAPKEPAASEQAQSPTIESQFVEAVTDVCLAALQAGQSVAGSPDALTHLRPATDATRAGHPFGHDRDLWEFASRDDGKITVRSPDNRTCSVFAVDAPPGASFEALALALAQRGGFTEIENRQRDGRVQRTFRSADGHVRVELEGFVGGFDAFAGSTNLSMAHIGRH